ncbi:MAG: 50S ribosomal protein L15 [Gammaproteobacteria bacterium]|nr:50S ribosomal protein L15 [Gammaproteobacteria bacterium]
MRLNTVKGAVGARTRRKRVGRGMGSGMGKTSGRGHKGQKSRAGGYHKVGFEGGQMPIQRRLPKRGFRSLTRADTAEVKLSDLNRIDAEVIDLAKLCEYRLVRKSAKRAKVIVSGELSKAVNLKGIRVTRGARELITKAGGTVVE